MFAYTRVPFQMQQQATRLAKLNAILRRKHFVSKRQADQLLSEKNDLELMLQTKEHLIQQMREHVCHHHHGPTNEHDRTSPSPNVGMTASMIKELASPGTPVSITDCVSVLRFCFLSSAF